MARRTTGRLLALGALAAVAAAVAAVVLGGVGSDDSGGAGSAGAGGAGGSGSGPAAAGSGSRGAAADPLAAPRPGPDAVRNAAPQPGWRPHSGAVPILRYHAVGDFAAGEPFPELFVEPADFEAQMDWLEDHGYQAVGLATVERAWLRGGTLPSRPVVLSFDGVRGELATTVLADLSRRGWPGVLVLDSESPPGPAGVLGRLLDAGWEVEAEGAEPAAARGALEAKLGVPVANYSFPRQSDDHGAGVAAVKAAGYAGATVVGPGFAKPQERYEMPRLTVFGLSRIDGFAEAIRSRGEGAGA
jgi:hypothetical protein